jgi:hypothetical protein
MRKTELNNVRKVNKIQVWLSLNSGKNNPLSKGYPALKDKHSRSNLFSRKLRIDIIQFYLIKSILNATAYKERRKTGK